MTKLASLGRLSALILTIALGFGFGFANARELTFEERLQAQKAIEEVYWRHRIWPKENPAPKPALATVMPESLLRARVGDYLEKSDALRAVWRRPITADQLQAALDRMARASNDRGRLRELFDALGNDPFVIAETLVRQTLAERLARDWYGAETFDTWWNDARSTFASDVPATRGSFTLPKLDAGACTLDTWSPTRVEVPDARTGQVSVWTGSEMIVWGGLNENGIALNSGGRYNPATDTWTGMSLGANVPQARLLATAVWTGMEMIVWGGDSGAISTRYNTGARYNPASDSWTSTSVGSNVPQPRAFHSAIWTGSEMIVWGGYTGSFPSVGDGGRYNPAANTWTAVSTGLGTPTPRQAHTAIWSGSEMIVWGGTVIGPGTTTNIGGRYDPSTDTWHPTSVGSNVPVARDSHTAVWTGSEMIVWGGSSTNSGPTLNSGGRYNASTDSWLPTSLGANVPTPRSGHAAVWTGSKMIVWRVSGGLYDPLTDTWTSVAAAPLSGKSLFSAIWTGSEMIVWGGYTGSHASNTGGRYDPASNTWVSTSMGSTVPPAVEGLTSVWTGSEMIVWGGYDYSVYVNSGGRYDPATDTWHRTSVSAGVPAARENHTAVWTGSEMIVWGGLPYTNTGGRYNPLLDSWRPTSLGAGVPSARQGHTVVWTGREMIVWGGGMGSTLNTGGRYSPATDSWVPTSIGSNTPAARSSGVSLWTGNEMIVWGGMGTSGLLNTGGRYDPIADSWLPTSTAAGVPDRRSFLSGVWTGSEMIVWGGQGPSSYVNTGGRYRPSDDTWSATSIGTNVPSPRGYQSAVWTGADMIVWGGLDGAALVKPYGGSRYDPSTNSWSLMPDWPYGKRSLIAGAAAWTGTELIAWGGDPPTATGAVYCACPSGRLIYRDADGDGFGDPGVSIPSCEGSIVTGYVADDTDCNDADPNTHSATCGEIDSGVRVYRTGTGATMTWNPAKGATTSSVVRGGLSSLPVGSVPADETCLASRVAIPTAAVTDTDVPEAGTGFWYLVRGENSCGLGPYGFQGLNGVPTVPEVGSGCP